MIQTIRRNKDIFMGNEDLKRIFYLEHFPIYMGVTDEPVEQDEFVGMEWMISESSGMIQLGTLLPEDVLYAKSHFSGIGKTWRAHYNSFSAFLNSYVTRGGVSRIIEIGGGNGVLNSIYNELYSEKDWLIIEPSNVKKVESCHAKYVRELWNKSFVNSDVFIQTCSTKNKIIIHTNLIEHIFNIREFMSLANKTLDIDEMMIFSMPNLKEQLLRKYTNALNFEHTFLLTEEYIEDLICQYGFDIEEKVLFDTSLSIFYAIRKKSSKITERGNLDYPRLYEKNEQIIRDFLEYYEKLIVELNEKIEKESRPIYLFGAHIFSQYLIQFGLETKKIVNILDNDFLKQEHRLYGTNMIVKSPHVLETLDSAVVILKVGQYADEIKQDILENVNCNVEFWE